MSRPRGGVIRSVAPLIVLATVAAVDLLVGRESVVLGLVVMAPLLAAGLVGPRLTAAYGILALGVAALLGVYNNQYQEGAWVAQAVRLGAVVAATVIGVATATYRLRREEHLARLTRVAEVAQRAILLPVPSRLDGVDLAVHYESAAAEAVIGGDLYAAVSTPYGLRILVGDVRGKGLEAVRLAAQVLAAFRERASDRGDLTLLAADLDRAVKRSAGSEDFVTAVLAQVTETGQLRLVNAGHPPPLLIRQGRVVLLEPDDPFPPLGLGAVTFAQDVLLERDDRLLLYTDGLTEARRPQDRRFIPTDAIGAALATGSLTEGLEALRATLLDWSGGHLQDDVALVAVQLAARTTRGGAPDPRYADHATSPVPDRAPPNGTAVIRHRDTTQPHTG